LTSSKPRMEPAQLLVDHVSLLLAGPLPGPVLDLACGDGRNGIFLAREQLEVICCDRSAEALEKAKELATAYGANLEVWQVDLEREGVNPLAADYYGAILVFRYLHRPLIPCIRKGLRNGGLLIYETFTVDQPRFGKPHNPNFLLDPGELHEMFGDWQVYHYFEGIRENPTRAVAQIVCRKPAVATRH
jgi:tellurite methyltransferase